LIAVVLVDEHCQRPLFEPPLAKSLVDEAGVNLLLEWIESLKDGER